MTNPPSAYVTLLLETPSAAFDEPSFVATRKAEASEVGGAAEVFRFAPLREGASGTPLVTVIHHGAPFDPPPRFGAAGTELDAVATFRLRNPVEGSRPGFETKGLLLGITDCADPSRLDEFQRWYDEHHASDVVRSGIYESAARYERIDGPVGTYLALYSTTRDEPEAFRSYLAWPERDQTRCEVFVVRQVGTYRRIG